MTALPLNRRNLPARSVLRHSSGNEMRPASRITYSDLACYQRGCPKSSCCALYMAEAASHNRQKAPLLVCTSCETTLPTGGVHLPRRKFLALLGAALAVPLSGPAAEKGAPPKPQNVLSPDQALDRLMQGNRRYLGGNMRRHDFSAERPALALGQNPFAGVLSCADSRIGPEYAFDSGRGDLFVCRVAGNFANADSIASFEYAVSALGTPLILVLGHEACGAVDATIKQVKNGASFPGHIPSLTKALTPAVKAVLNQPGDLLANAIKENVRLTVQKLQLSGPILSKGISEKKLKIVGGVYDLQTGRVELVSS
jgi:carbonic anhydrase